MQDPTRTDDPNALKDWATEMDRVDDRVVQELHSKKSFAE